MTDRLYWLRTMDRIARPVLTHLAAGTLKAAMPIASSGDPAERAQYMYLEAFGRTLCGVAPFLALEGLSGDEAALQAEFIALARQGLLNATDPTSPDYMNFSRGDQPIVDANRDILRALGEKV